VTTPDVDPPLGGIVGTSINRVDGPLKVAGRAPYSAEFPLDDLLYGVMVQSTIARGAIVETDTSAASRLIAGPGANVRTIGQGACTARRGSIPSAFSVR